MLALSRLFGYAETLLAHRLLLCLTLLFLLASCGSQENEISEHEIDGVIYSIIQDRHTQTWYGIAEREIGESFVGYVVRLNMASGTVVPILESGASDTYSVAIAQGFQDSQLLVPGEYLSRDHTGDVFLIDGETRESLGVYNGRNGVLNVIANNNKSLLFAGGYTDGWIYIWDKSREDPIFTRQISQSPVSAVLISDKGIYASGGVGQNQSLLMQIDYSTGIVDGIGDSKLPAVDMQGCGTSIYAVNMSSGFWVYDTDSSELDFIELIGYPNLELNKMAVDCEQEMIVLAGVSRANGQDSYIIFAYDLSRDRVIGKLDKHAISVYSLAIDVDAQKIISVDYNGEMYVWNRPVRK